MKKSIHVIQYGLGNVGTKLLELIEDQNQNNGDIEIKYVAIAEIEGGVINAKGIDIIELLNAKKNKAITKLQNFEPGLNDARLIDRISNQKMKNCVVIDVTASNKMVPCLAKALHSGYHVVMANKKPLSASFEEYNILHNASEIGKSKLLFECTVGAGLPIIYTAKSLLSTGDKIIEINGCFSGTLGYIFSELDRGIGYSEIVKKARHLGYTEPDPRDDLSGMDVARKALILARLCGYELELEDLKVENLVPSVLQNCSSDEFLEKLELYNNEFSSRFSKAKNIGNTLRYIASIKNGQVSVGVKEVPKNSQIGALSGPENICIFRTKRYSSSPLVIQGPGAGVEVTADGVLRNILECIE